MPKSLRCALSHLGIALAACALPAASAVAQTDFAQRSETSVWCADIREHGQLTLHLEQISGFYYDQKEFKVIEPRSEEAPPHLTDRVTGIAEGADADTEQRESGPRERTVRARCMFVHLKGSPTLILYGWELKPPEADPQAGLGPSGLPSTTGAGLSLPVAAVEIGRRHSVGQIVRMLEASGAKELADQSEDAVRTMAPQDRKERSDTPPIDQQVRERLVGQKLHNCWFVAVDYGSVTEARDSLYELWFAEQRSPDVRLFPPPSGQ